MAQARSYYEMASSTDWAAPAEAVLTLSVISKEFDAFKLQAGVPLATMEEKREYRRLLGCAYRKNKHKLRCMMEALEKDDKELEHPSHNYDREYIQLTHDEKMCEECVKVQMARPQPPPNPHSYNSTYEMLVRNQHYKRLSRLPH